MKSIKDINAELINNMLEQSRVLLEKTIILSEDTKIRAGAGAKAKLDNEIDDKTRDEIIEQLIKESEQIRKNSSQVLSNVIQILEMNEQK